MGAKMSDCFCTKNYQCLACERQEKKYATPKPRRIILTPNKVAQCGTRAGYNRHRRLGEPTCLDCRAAQTKSVKKWQQENPEGNKLIRERSAKKAKAS